MGRHVRDGREGVIDAYLRCWECLAVADAV